MAEVERLRAAVAQIVSGDRLDQGEAFQQLSAEAEQVVPWAYQVWDQLLLALSSKDNRARAIAGQLLCRLAKSDPDRRMLIDFDRVFALTRDEKFVTARHTLQAAWQVAVISAEHRRMVIAALEAWFAECADHKNVQLIRLDILESLRTIERAIGDEGIRAGALALIESDPDASRRARYGAVWRKAG